LTKSAQKGNTFLIILMCAAIVVGAVIFYTNSFQENATLDTANTPSPTPATTKFQSSSVMKFSIDVQQNFVVQDNNGFITIMSGENQILISKNGTNFNNINDFLETLQNQNRFKLTDPIDLLINDAEAIAGTFGEEKIYYVMPNGAYRVYILSTKSPQLYSALDQIAKSFRYTP